MNNKLFDKKIKVNLKKTNVIFNLWLTFFSLVSSDPGHTGGNNLNNTGMTPPNYSISNESEIDIFYQSKNQSYQDL